jgi:hypothetical protein
MMAPQKCPTGNFRLYRSTWARTIPFRIAQSRGRDYALPRMWCGHTLVIGWTIPGIFCSQEGAGSTGAQIAREQRSLQQFEHDLPYMLFPVKSCLV